MPALRRVLRALVVDRRLIRWQVVAVVAESVGRGNGLPSRILEVAEGDDVAVAGGEVDRRVDLERGLRRTGGVRVDLDPDGPAPASLGIDHDHGSVGLGVPAEVVERHRIRLLQRGGIVQARHLEDDPRSGAEAVVVVVRSGIHRHVPGVPRHRAGMQIHPAARCRRFVRDRVVVVGEGE
jgi:hypothetical protein